MMSTLFANVAVVGQHCHRRAPRSRRRQRWLAALLLLLLFPQTPSWADEVVRQVQEELRRRNLYYGDIDGRNSRAVASALRRYQERKGFPVSGAPDDETLHSLGIAPPAATVVQTSGSGGGGDNQAASRETSANSEVWPQGTVLKSDSARRHHGAFADGVRGLTPLSTAEAAEVAMPSPELLMMPPASASVLVAPSPASSGS
ncbi:MAG: peptidoglycan-binding protein, partial [Verrucomicrobia bacterium]|nr:peptidoglycan-binding protein [Verrucomicrobiota bacterium]